MTLAEFMLPATAENVAGERIPTPRLVTHYRSQWRREPCVYCGKSRAELPRKAMTKEHIMPLSLCEGRTGRTWENLATACVKCNTERGNMPLLRFLALKSYELMGRRLTKKQRKAMGFVRPQVQLDKVQPTCHSNGIKELPNMSNATPVTGGFIGGGTSHWDRTTLAKAQENHAATKRAFALDFHAGEK